MPSYRFCRPDNIPLLVQAVNECYHVHFPGAVPMTVECFRREMRYLDVWPSNSMVALDETGPIAVSIGTKRAAEVLVARLGVRPDRCRCGHGLHILTSLSHKLAVLGPERLVAEVPLALPGAPELFAAVGYRREATYADWVRPPGPVDPVPADWLIPTSATELLEQDLIDIPPDVAWERSRDTVKNRQDDLEGIAVASPERLETFLLYRDADDGTACDLIAAGGPESERWELFLELLIRHLATEASLPLRFPKLSEGELPRALLERLGFAPTERYERLSAQAEPG